MIQKKSGGFTLLEVLVTATIIAILTAIGIVSYASVNKRSRDVKRKSDLEQVRSALEMYRSDNNGEYPYIQSSYSNPSNLSSSLVSTYLPAVPDDPDSNKNYYYRATATNGVYTNYCVCAYLETLAEGVTESTCTISLPVSGACNYGLKSP